MKEDHFLFCLSAFLFLTILIVAPAEALDELVLAGIIKSIDVQSKNVMVEVHSGSCPGPGQFRVDNVEDLSALLDKKVSFRIDSNTCSDGKVRKMSNVVPHDREGRR